MGSSNRELGEALSLLAGQGSWRSWRRLLPLGLSTALVALAVFCGQLVLSVRGIRMEVSEHVAAIVDLQGRRDRISELVHAAPDANDRHALAAAILDEVAEIDGSEALLAAVESWRHTTPAASRGATRRLARAGEDFEQTISKRVRARRQLVGALSSDLGAKWDDLYLLAAFCVVAGGAFSFVLVRLVRQADRLELNTRAQRKLIETAQSVIFVVTADGRKAYVNEASRRLYGYAPEELIGQPITKVLDPERIDQEMEVLSGILEGESIFDYETVCIHKSGRKVPVLYNATAIRDARGHAVGCLGTATDLTESKSVQQQLLRHERQEALGVMASGVAHDFNNLLTVILGLAERETEERPDAKRVSSIQDAADRARRMVARLLVFSEQRQCARTRLDLGATVTRMEGLLESILAGKGGLDIRVPAEPIAAEADWSQVEQVVMNLVLNARDAIEIGGSVTVTVGERQVDPVRATELGIEPGTWACIAVQDDGCGMDSPTLARAFEPFFTTKERGHGTGLGLATVQGIVQQHGGIVDPRSRPDHGTEFAVLLPKLAVESPIPG
ncbi:MAG: PAS domain S-box protein [Planctomycetota bacterium]